MRFVFPTVDTEDLSTPFRRGEYRDTILDHENATRLVSSVFRSMKIRAVFFVAVTERFRIGERIVESVLNRLLMDGHEIALHTHPIWGDPKGREHLWQMEPAEQCDYLGKEKDYLESRTGKPVLGHRAGAYGLDANALAALSANRIPLDSSMFYGHPNCKVTWSMNRVEKRDGILEIPVTGFFRTDRIRLGPGTLRKRRKFLKTDLNGCGEKELEWFLDQMPSQGIEVMNFFMHSYSLLDRSKLYGEFAADPERIGKLERLLARMQESADVRFLDCAEALRIFPGQGGWAQATERSLESARERTVLSALRERWKGIA